MIYGGLFWGQWKCSETRQVMAALHYDYTQGHGIAHFKWFIFMWILFQPLTLTILPPRHRAFAHANSFVETILCLLSLPNLHLFIFINRWSVHLLHSFNSSITFTEKSPHCSNPPVMDCILSTCLSYSFIFGGDLINTCLRYQAVSIRFVILRSFAHHCVLST